MAVKTQLKRMINTPDIVTRNQSNVGGQAIAGGNGVSTATARTLTPPSISNPASLTPGVQSMEGKTSIPMQTTAPMPKSPTTMPVPVPNGVNVNGTVPTTPGLAKPAVPNTTPVATTPVTAQNTTNTSGIDTQNQNNPYQYNTNTNLFDENNFLNTGLSKTDFYNQTPENIQLGINNAVGSEQERKALLDQVGYIQSNEHLGGVYKDQEANRLAQKSITDNIDSVASSQRIQEASQKLSNLKQNIAFLGSQGRPVKSAAALDATQRQLSAAETTFQVMKNVEDQYNSLSGLQTESQAKAYEEKMYQLGEDLKKNTDDAVLQAYLGYQRDFQDGKIDTPKKMFEFQQRYLDQIDTSVEGFTNRNLQLLTRMQDQAKVYVEDTKKKLEEEQAKKAEFEKNKNTVNKDMSEALGMYVDGNGNQLIDADTGKGIVFDPLKNEKPVITSEGYMITRYTDPVTGQPVTDVKRIYKPDVKPENLSVQVVGQHYDENAGQMVNDYGYVKNDGTVVKLGGGGMTSNTNTGNTSEIVDQISDPGTALAIADFSQNKRGRTNLQCGELVNDYLLDATGSDPKGDMRLENTYADKIKAVQTIGQANGPVAGGIFVSNPLNNGTGHTGIVTSVNADGSFNVLEANAAGKIEGQAPITKTYPSTAGFTFSQPPSVSDTAGLSAEAREALNAKTINNIPTAKTREKVLRELTKNGQFEKGLGNSNLFTAKKTDREAIPEFIKGYNEWQKALDIIGKYEQNGQLDQFVGGFDQWKMGLANKTASSKERQEGIGKDFATLESILGKGLSSYMNKISGATVGDAEVERLKKQVPNLGTSETEFRSNVQLYKDSMEAGLSNMLEEYGFSDLDSAKQVMGIKGDTNSNISTEKAPPGSKPGKYTDANGRNIEVLADGGIKYLN